MKNEFLEGLKKEFKITVKPTSYLVGLDIESTLDGVVKVSQSAYAKKLLTKFEMSDCKPVSTPIVKEFNYSEKEQEVVSQKLDYREVIGALMSGSHPDLAYAVSAVSSRTLDNPSPRDYVILDK